MKTYKIKDLYKALSTDSLLFDSYLTSFYPTIEGNESNFLTDYASGHAYFDKAFNQKYGERLIDLEAETVSAAITEARGIFSAVAMLNLANWARLYYALSLDYNPLYNVDGLTTYTHGATSATDSYGIDKTTNSYASRQDSTVYGNTSQTVGQHTDTDTDYSVAYDSATESETGKSTHDSAQVTTTEISHTDTFNAGAHNDTVERDARSDTHTTLQSIDTELRQGNIGVTKSTDLLQGTYDLYTQTRSFWETVFKAMVTEGGAYYDYSAL